MLPTTKIPESKLDPEIRDIIYAINRLPFAKTLYCCAGYGPLSPDDIKIAARAGEKVVKHAPTEGVYDGYVSVLYYGADEWYAFDDRLALAADFDTREPYKGAEVLVSYYFEADDEAALKQKWDAVRAILRKALAVRSNKKGRFSKR